MKLIARLFALSLVATGAFASTQIRNAAGDVAVGARIGMCPPAVCNPGGTSCHLGD